MDTHPTDPVALVAGMFFGLAGLAIFANQQWDDVDVTAFTAAGVMVIGLLLFGFVIARFVNDSPVTPVSDTRHDTPSEPTFETAPGDDVTGES